MRKQHSLIFTLICTLIGISFSACGLKSEQKVEFEEDTTDYASIYRDSTLYGICGEGSSMNILQLFTDIGDTIDIDLGYVKEHGLLLGGFQPGDRMAIMPGKKKNSVKLIINESTLLGDWVQPNPIDGSSEMGFRLKEGGIAESIEQSSIIYKSWRIFNGRLEVVTQMDGGGDMEEVTLYEILKLSSDTLVIRDNEDIHEYGRHHKSDYENVEIELEDASSEFHI